MPKKIQKMLNRQKMDDDNDTTASQIQKAICKNMENLCFNLKKINKGTHDFEYYYLKKRPAESDFTSNDSTLSEPLRGERKFSWSGSDDEKKVLKRTRSMKVKRTVKRFTNRSRQTNSVGRIQKVSKQRLSNLT